MDTIAGRRTAILLPALLLGAAAAGLAPARADGTPACRPVALAGGVARTVHGRIRTPQDRFRYCFSARAGETLHDRFRGPAVRLVLISPDGTGNGPGLPDTVTLDQTGRYRLDVSPDTMAEGIFGPFALTLTLK